MKKIDAIFVNGLFEYDGYACNCVVDTQNLAPGEPPKMTIKMNSAPDKILHYSYIPKEGLTLTRIGGRIIESNVLGKILALPENNLDEYITFFNKFGFFLPLQTEVYDAIDSSDLILLVNRLKATIELMGDIAKKNYRRMFDNIVFLLYSPEIRVEFSKGTLASCNYKFSSLIRNFTSFPDISRDDEVAAKGTYSVPDTFLGRNNHVDFNFYNLVKQGARTDIKGTNTPWFRNLMAAYVGCRNQPPEVRAVIDFFYHFQTEITMITDVRYRHVSTLSDIEENSFNESIKTSLTNVAHIVLSNEINSNIKGIHPQYDTQTLSQKWKVETLQEAIYFSIFYMKAGVEIYKECANLNCKKNKYFLVENTRANKKYCCIQCANAAAAQRHRNRVTKDTISM